MELYSARIVADQNLVFVEYVGMQWASHTCVFGADMYSVFTVFGLHNIYWRPSLIDGWPTDRTEPQECHWLGGAKPAQHAGATVANSTKYSSVCRVCLSLTPQQSQQDFVEHSHQLPAIFAILNLCYEVFKILLWLTFKIQQLSRSFKTYQWHIIHQFLSWVCFGFEDLVTKWINADQSPLQQHYPKNPA